MERSLIIIAATAALAAGGAVEGSTPPAINYQGVLLDQAGAPENGDRDMIFHFHDAAGGGEILTDLHTRADSRAVTVVGGMFNVQLGTGLIQDGSGSFPNDPYSSLEQVFRDFSEVMLEVEIRVGPAGGTGAFETLSPMTRIVSAPYALNAGLLAGKSAPDFIDRSTTAQTKAGDLTVANLTASGNSITFSAAGASLAASATSLFLSAGNQDTDNLFLIAGNSGDDGSMTIFGDGIFEMRAGNGLFSFVDGVTLQQRAQLDGLGNLQIDGDMTVMDNEVTFGHPGARVLARPNGLELDAGDLDTDGLLLNAGNSFDDGSLFIGGDGVFVMRAGDGEFSFVNGSTGSERAHLDQLGNLQIDGNLTLIGGHAIGTLFLGGLQIRPGAGQSLDIMSDDFVTTHIDFDGSPGGATADWCANGGCSGASQLMELQEDGDLRIGGALFQNQFDLAEAYLKGEAVEAGDLVRLHPARRGAVLLSSGAEDATVLGVVSERPGIVLGGAPFGVERLERMWGPDIRERFEQQRDRLVAEAADLHPALDSAEARQSKPDRLESLALEAFYAESFVPVALAGRVPVKADARFGEIVPGDSLSPSPIPGVAMKSDGRGVIVGIALEGLVSGRGVVEAFVWRDRAGVSRADLAQACEDLGARLEERTPDPATGVQTMAGHLQIVLDAGQDDRPRMSVFRNEHEEPAAELFRVDERGDVYAKGSFRPNAMDVAELLPLGEPAAPGEVVAADPARPGRYRPAREAHDPTVIGVVAERPGMLLGGGADSVLAADAVLAAQLLEARLANDRQAEARIWRQLESRFHESHAAVAMSGTVLVKADASYGAIRRGDLLASSPTPGHAMGAEDPAPQGTVIGKALEPLGSGRGVIRMLVMPR